MPLYRHSFNGRTSLQTGWAFTWWANSTVSIDGVHGAAEAWATTVFGATGLGPLIPTNVSLTEIVTGLMDGSGSPTQLEVRRSTVAIAGTGATDPFPTDVSVCVSIRTNLANRRGRGRFYLPQFTADTVDIDGRVDPAVQQTIRDALQSAFQTYASTATPGVFSRVNATFQNANTFDVGDLFDTRRARQGNVPENRLSGTIQP